MKENVKYNIDGENVSMFDWNEAKKKDSKSHKILVGMGGKVTIREVIKKARKGIYIIKGYTEDSKTSTCSFLKKI